MIPWERMLFVRTFTRLKSLIGLTHGYEYVLSLHVSSFIGHVRYTSDLPFLSRIQHSSVPIIFTTVQHIPALLTLSSSLPIIKLLVCVDALNSETKKVLAAWAELTNVTVMDFPQCLYFQVGYIALWVCLPYPYSRRARIFKSKRIHSFVSRWCLHCLLHICTFSALLLVDTVSQWFLTCLGHDK